MEETEPRLMDWEDVKAAALEIIRKAKIQGKINENLLFVAETQIKKLKELEQERIKNE